MKKLATLLFFSFTSVLGFAQTFKEGNLVVMRYGDGSSALSYQPAPIFFDEYPILKSTAPVKTIAAPIANTGSNFKITGVPKQGTTVTQEGLMTLSADGKYLTFCGYAADPGTSSREVNRVIGLMDANGKINTTTTLPAADIAQIRIAVTDGKKFWVTGAGSGIRSMNIGANSATLIAAQPQSNRSLAIVNNQLYGSTSGTPAKIFTVGTGLPTDEGNRVLLLPIGGSTVAANQFLLLDADPAVAGPDLLYLVNDGASPDQSAIQKFTFDGAKWIEKGSITVAGTTDNLKSLTGTITGGTAFIYAVTGGSDHSASVLLKITDPKAAKSSIDSKIAAPEVLATAPINTMFRSVVFSPVK